MNKSEKSLDKSGNQKQSGDKIPQESGKTDKKSKTAKELISSHLKDQKHVITDEEFKELDVTASVNSDSSHEPLEIESNKERPKDEAKDHHTKTPWDVLN